VAVFIVAIQHYLAGVDRTQFLSGLPLVLAGILAVETFILSAGVLVPLLLLLMERPGTDRCLWSMAVLFLAVVLQIALAGLETTLGAAATIAGIWNVTFVLFTVLALLTLRFVGYRLRKY
jgi:hypothetical protein